MLTANFPCPTPVPWIFTVCAPVALSVNVTDEVNVPAVVGLKVTPITQFPPWGRMAFAVVAAWVQVVRFAPVPEVIRANAELPVGLRTGSPPVGIVMDVFPAFVR